MEWMTYLDHLRSDGELLAAAGERGLDADVPCCPGWTVGDVVAHTGRVHRHRARTVEERLIENPDHPEVPTEGLIDWYREGLEKLLAALSNAEPAEHVYTWNPNDRTVGFWYQRMAHETLIHRVDAEQGHGPVSRIDAALAADGIDEVLTKYVGGYPEWGTFRPSDNLIRITCRDEPGRWTIRFGRFSGTSPATGNTHRNLEAFEVVDPTHDPEAIVEGTAADLDLWLWGRGPIGQLSISGNEGLAHRLRRICAEDM